MTPLLLQTFNFSQDMFYSSLLHVTSLKRYIVSYQAFYQRKRLTFNKTDKQRQYRHVCVLVVCFVDAFGAQVINLVCQKNNSLFLISSSHYHNQMKLRRQQGADPVRRAVSSPVEFSLDFLWFYFSSGGLTIQRVDWLFMRFTGEDSKKKGLCRLKC